jgi:parvulin-like peptidyl-prolyl isomerase
MMQHMRNRAPIYFIVTLGSFLLFGFVMWGRGTLSGQASPDVIGKVNGESITQAEYRQALSNAYASYRGHDLGDAERAALEEQTWQTLVRDHLFAQLVRRYGITVTDDEIVQAVRTSPPQEIAQLPQFQTNGQFDPAKYRQALQDPRIDWSPIEERVRQMLPVQKLEERVLAGVIVPEAEVRQAYIAEREQANITYVLSNALEVPVDSSSIGEAQIQAYYNAHEKDFTKPEMVKLFAAQVPKMPSTADRATAMETVKGVLEELRSGRTFDEVAKASSEGPWASEGGMSPQPVPLERIPPAVRAALDRLQPGQVSDPVPDQDQVHILKLDSRTTTADGKPAIKYGDIVVRVRAGEETVRHAREKADELIEKAKEVGLQQAAADLKVPSGATDYFERDTPIPGLDIPALMEFAFSEKVGSLSPIYDRPNGLYVVSVMDHRAAGLRPLAEVRAEVRQKLIRERQMAAAKTIADRVSRAAAGGASLEDAARQAGLAPVTPPPVTRMQDPSGLSGAAALLGAAFSAPIGRVTGPIQLETGWAVLRVNSRTPADMAQYPAERQAIRQRITQEKQQAALQRWFADIVKKAKIKDLRARSEQG